MQRMDYCSNFSKSTWIKQNLHNWILRLQLWECRELREIWCSVISLTLPRFHALLPSVCDLSSWWVYDFVRRCQRPDTYLRANVQCDGCKLSTSFHIKEYGWWLRQLRWCRVHLVVRVDGYAYSTLPTSRMTDGWWMMKIGPPEIVHSDPSAKLELGLKLRFMPRFTSKNQRLAGALGIGQGSSPVIATPSGQLQYSDYSWPARNAPTAQTSLSRTSICLSPRLPVPHHILNIASCWYKGIHVY